MRFRRLAAAAASVLLVTLTAVALTPSPAAAASTVDVACAPGSTRQTFSPGITNTPGSTAFTTATSYTPCASSDPSLTSGMGGFGPITLTLTCNTVATLTANTVLNWNNGQSSTLHLTGHGLQSITVSGTVITQYVLFDGTVTAGEFAGDNVSLYLVYPGNQWAACATGLTSLSGHEVLTITAP